MVRKDDQYKLKQETSRLITFQCLPYNKEGVTTKVPALYDIFGVLKHDFDECSEISSQNGGVKV